MSVKIQTDMTITVENRHEAEGATEMFTLNTDRDRVVLYAYCVGDDGTASERVQVNMEMDEFTEFVMAANRMHEVMEKEQG